MSGNGDYISREAALKLIDRYWQQAYNAHFFDAAVRLGSVYRETEDIPAADVRPVVHGKWIKCRKNYSKCSECGTAYSHPVDWTPDKYCSECGARLFMED